MKLLLMILMVSISHAAFSEQVVVGQKNKSFVLAGKAAYEITIAVGDTVRFKNEDSFFHNVFSLSDILMFDLGSFPKGEYRDVIFESTGTVEVECAIHPEMMIKVNVK